MIWVTLAAATSAAPQEPRWKGDIDEIRAKAKMDALELHIDVDEIREKAQRGVDAIMAKPATLGGMFGMDHGLAFFQPNPKPRPGRHDNDDRAYQRGQRALDSRNWDEALQSFTQVAGSGGTRADGALYWKAYALAKLGRRDEGVAAIKDYRSRFARM
jgi:hypothetical protein